MHVYDIEDALDQADTHSLQHAFRVLVEYPHRGTVEGARLAGKLDQLLDLVGAGLQLDHTDMPEDLREAVERVTGVTFEPGTSYAHAAIVVCEFRERWHTLYRSGQRDELFLT